jgi:hypothetical protein
MVGDMHRSLAEERPDGRRRYHPTDFSDSLWRNLLDYAIERADTFRCALPYRFVQVDFEHAPLWPQTLEAHRGALIERYVSHIRAERTREHPTQFAVFTLTPQVERLIRGVTSLQNWSWRHGLPEDPSFLAGTEVVIDTESGPGRIVVYADEREFEALGAAGVRLIEPLGVEAAPWPTP